MKCKTVTVLVICLAIGVISARNSAGQVVGCAPAEARATLDAANVRTSVFNNGSLHFSGGHGYPAIYEVPKDSGAHASFSASLIVGGLVNDELRVAGSVYGNYEFWPGPAQLPSSDPSACAEYDRLFSVYHREIQSGELTDDIMDWPWELGAPVVDGDGVPENYNPLGGDRPLVVGDQSIWWLMNDTAGLHTRFDTAALGLEVEATAFVWDLHEPVRNTTFYRYKMRNVSNETITDAYLGFAIDVDLGEARNDYMASDSSLGLAYYYNRTPVDAAYEGAPPAIGYTFIRGPHRQLSSSPGGCVVDPGEQLTTTSHQFVVDSNPEPVGWPQTAQSAYYAIQGLDRRDGSPMRVGYWWLEDNQHLPETKWNFAGDPITSQFPSEVNIDGAGTQMSSWDRKSMMGMGPFCLNPGDEQEFVLAVVWSQGTDNLDSVRQLKKDVALIRNAEGAWIGSRSRSEEPPIETPEPEIPLQVNGIYPNPATDQASLEYSLPQSMRVRLEVFDVLGRRVHDSGDEVRGAGEYTARFDTSSWTAGVYTARLQLDHITTTRTFTVVK